MNVSDAIKGKRIFITGGAGFIGTTLASRLVENNRIIVYDNFRRNALKDTSLASHPNVEVMHGDVLDLDTLRACVHGAHYVIHMAAIAGIDTVIKSPVSTMKVNLIGTYNVLEAVKDLDTLERFVDFSTSEVFGSYAYKSEETHSTNLQPVGEARWVYATSKLAGEHLAHSYHKEYKVPALSIRPFNVYGPGQIGEGAIHVFVQRAIDNQTIEIHGDGDQIRSWCYVDDMIEGILLCLVRDEAVGNVFNIGNPRGTVTILSLAEKIIHLAGSKSAIVHVPKCYVDVELRIPNIEKAKELLGYEPRVDLEEGLTRTIEWYRKASH